MAKGDITWEAIMKEVDSRQLRPVYYLMGEEPYYIDLVAGHIAETVLTEDERDFNQTIVYAQDTTMRAIIDMARRYPVMAERQVVIVKEAQNLKEQVKELSAYLQKPMPSTLLVFCHKNGNLNRKTYGKVATDIVNAGGAIFESKKIPEGRLRDFVLSYVRQKGGSIDDRAAMILVEHVGADLNRMASELDKLLVNCPAGSVITPEWVETCTGISKDYNIFELKNALVAKDIERAMRIAKYMEDNVKLFPVQMVFATLFQYFSNLMLSYYSPQRTPDGVAAYLGLSSSWGVNDYLTGMRNYSAFKTMDIISTIRRYDGMSKGIGAANSGAGLLLELVYYILH